MAGARHWARQAFNNQNDDEGYGPGSGSQSWWWSTGKLKYIISTPHHTNTRSGWHGDPLRNSSPPLLLRIRFLRRRLLPRPTPTPQRQGTARIPSLDGEATTNILSSTTSIRMASRSKRAGIRSNLRAKLWYGGIPAAASRVYTMPRCLRRCISLRRVRARRWRIRILARRIGQARVVVVGLLSRLRLRGSRSSWCWIRLYHSSGKASILASGKRLLHRRAVQGFRGLASIHKSRACCSQH